MIHILTSYIRRLVCVLTATLLVFAAAPGVALADPATDPAGSASGTTCSPVLPAPTGIQQPTGADAATYTYNSCTGLWENAYYIWNPATQTASPRTPPVYTCDQTTWTWLTYIWTYNAASKSYDQIPAHVSALPAGAVVDPSSPNPCAPQPVANTASVAIASGPDGGATTTTTGIQNQLVSSAGSGNATVDSNTLAGDATSGNASAMATIINAVQSSTGLTGGTVATFTANIDGDVQGDLVIDPSQLQPASAGDALAADSISLNNQTNGQITNNIELTAASGNAAVTNNTKAGSATTGNATAIANVVNVLNSLVSAGKSFVGVININGNMRGNILLPQQLLTTLLASNAPSTTVTLSAAQTNSLGITSTNNLSTTNNITSSAATGSAAVTNNTKAGSATTGSATTQVRVFNLTGSQIVSANCLLVFVNVSGQWIGVIFSAPAGATAAALGSGVTTNTVNNAALTSTTNDSITNNIDVNASSGNALVANNTAAGSATTGDASAAVNLLNINNSDLNVSGWFGILFINIFGNWYGSLGVYDPAAHAGGHGAGGPSGSYRQPPRTFQFVPRTAASGAGSSGPTFSDVAGELAQHAGRVLATVAPTGKAKLSADTNLSTEAIGGIIVAVGLLLLATERLFSARQARLG